MAASVRILFYGINGVGLGHLSRLLAIAREARELTRALGLEADFQLVTTSEGSDLAWDFPVFKIPSASVVGATDSPRREFEASGKLLVSNVVAAFRPDILVLDTVPQGAFREFPFLRDYARATAFLDRIKIPEAVQDRAYLEHLAHYDLILVPDDEGVPERYPLPPRYRGRRCFVGRVHGFRPHEALRRDEVREYFAVPPDRTLIYVSGGGGGDPAAQHELEVLVDTLREDPSHHLLVGYGPLYRGRRIHRENVVPIVEPEARRFFPGLDLAVSAAGYNTYEELLAARVPTLFYAQCKGLDPQDRRAAEGARAGWHRTLDALEPALIRAEIRALKDPDCRRRLRAALDRRGCPCGALHAATELLNLHSGLKPSPVDRRRLYPVAGAYALWQGDPLVSFAESFAQMVMWQQIHGDRLAREEFRDAAVHAWRAEGGGDWEAEVGRGLAWGRQLAAWRRRLEWDESPWRRFLKAFGRETAEEPEPARRLLLRELLDRALTRLGDERTSYLLREVMGQGKRAEPRRRVLALLAEGEEASEGAPRSRGTEAGSRP